MGVSGPKILDDDAVCDVYGAYLDGYDRGTDPIALREEIFRNFGEMLEDPDEGPAFWLGLAKAQHECGALEDDVLRWVEDFVTHDQDRDRWPDDMDEDFLKQRRKHLSALLKAIKRPRVTPRRRRKPKGPVYRPGDCLAVRLSDGEYGAALVLASREDLGDGANLVGVLRYRGKEKPPREVFEARDWIIGPAGFFGPRPLISWCRARDHKRAADSLERIGKVDPGEVDTGRQYGLSEWDCAYVIEYFLKSKNTG